ncbi:MAG: T9SS type A sorting domain-containing protein [Tannerella sp.]|nr:T9SS type A sorting domain-containing protein [Tannerella sp.]
MTLPKVAGASSSPPPGIHTVRRRDCFTFTLTPHDGLTVTVTVSLLNSDINLNISDAAVTPVANASVRATAVCSDGGTLYIAASQSGEAYIYDISGQRVKTLPYLAGETTATQLPRGIYIVVAGEKHTRR